MLLFLTACTTTTTVQFTDEEIVSFGGNTSTVIVSEPRTVADGSKFSMYRFPLADETQVVLSVRVYSSPDTPRKDIPNYKNNIAELISEGRDIKVLNDELGDVSSIIYVEGSTKYELMFSKNNIKISLHVPGSLGKEKALELGNILLNKI